MTLVLATERQKNHDKGSLLHLNNIMPSLLTFTTKLNCFSQEAGNEQKTKPRDLFPIHGRWNIYGLHVLSYKIKVTTHLWRLTCVSVQFYDSSCLLLSLHQLFFLFLLQLLRTRCKRLSRVQRMAQTAFFRFYLWLKTEKVIWQHETRISMRMGTIVGWASAEIMASYALHCWRREDTKVC